MKRLMMYFLSSTVLATSTIAIAANPPATAANPPTTAANPPAKASSPVKANPMETVGIQAPISANELSQAITGWSAKRQILGKAVFNEKNEKLGVIDDLVITPDKHVTYAIIGAGGFLGVAKHDIAISMNHIERRGEKYMISGITKNMLEKTPEFKYTVSR